MSCSWEHLQCSANTLHLFQALAFQIFSLNLVVQVVDVRPVVFAPVDLKCALQHHITELITARDSV